MKTINPNQIKNANQVKAVTLGAMCLALFISNLNDTVMNVALPQIQVSLDASVSQLQWILNAYTLPIASLVLPSGTLGDIYGRKRIFLGGIVLFTLASVICGFADNLSILLVGRTIQGIGAAALIPASLAILVDTFPDPKEKAKAIGIWSAVSGLALIAGPILGGLLVDTIGWQSVFFLNLPLGIITFRITSRFVRQVAKPTKQTLDLPGMILSTLMLASVVFILTEGNFDQLWRSPLILLGVAVVSVAFLWVESRSPHPMLPLPLLGDSAIATVNIVIILLYFTMFSLLFIFNLFLQQVQGYSATAAGIRFLPMNLAFIVATFGSGWIAVRLGWRLTIAIGLTVVAVINFSFTQIGADTAYSSFWGQLVLAGFGGGLTISPLTAAAMSCVPTTKVGVASAILNSSVRIGGVLGIALQGSILSQRLAADLRRSLAAFDLSPQLQEQLIAKALHQGINTTTTLPPELSAVAWQQAFGNAFVAGLRTNVFLASALLLVGVGLILAFLPSNLKSRSS